jgi:hypothetical protein
MRQLLKRRARPAGVQVHHPRRALTFSFVVFALLIGLAVFASAAAADKPVRSQFTFSGSDVLTDICPFPITIADVGSGTETDFLDQSGALTRIKLPVDEQDTFSANGKSLTGVPYTFDIRVLFDSSGNVTHLFAAGIVEKVPLLGGGLFIAAGRVDFAAHGFPPFILTPDVGASVNLDGFCAALS